MTSIGFAVEGVPVPQGSKRIGRHGGRPVILDDNDVELRAWRRSVASAFRIAAGDEWAMLDCPVAVAVTFYFDRPKARKTEIAKATAPDIDKLARAVLDALADGDAYVNDGRVVALAATKQYVTDLHPVVGATIYLRTVSA